MGSSRTPLADRFWTKVARGATDECWDWRGARNRYGYGRLAWRVPEPHEMGAHVASWTLHYGPVPQGICVLHRCDRPACVNPGHLFLGTRRENNEDRARKGRTASHVGALNPNAKLTPDQVREMRSAYGKGGISQVSLAALYGVKQPQVSRLVRGVQYI